MRDAIESRRGIWLPVAFLAVTAIGPAAVQAGYPILSRFTRTADGPYQPQVRRFTVVDPTPVAPQFPVGRHGHVGGAHRHQADTTLWARREAAAPAYPYGWFGARHATEFSSRGSYYDDYEQTAILRGR